MFTFNFALKQLSEIVIFGKLGDSLKDVNAVCCEIPGEEMLMANYGVLSLRQFSF